MAGLGPTFGRGAMTNDWIDIKNSDCILVIGGNSAENHPAVMQWVHVARENGGKLVVVDPRFTRTAAVADIFGRLRSGTDIVFLGAMINYIIENKLYNEEYVKAFTNALTLINTDYKGPADVDGLFSGYKQDTRTYDGSSWQYQTEKKTVKDSTGKDVEVSVTKVASNLDDANTVWSILKKHYSRYTIEMVEKICGTTKDEFLAVAKAFGATGAPDKSGTVLYAMGQTQHTVGSQNIRLLGVLQLILGNIGVPGGGVNALRGESNVQGSTDQGLLYGSLPAYMSAPSDKDVDLATYYKKFDTTSYWANGPKFFNSMLKAWFGDAAKKDNDYCYDYLPKYSTDCSWMALFHAMAAGTIKGLMLMGQNPAVSGPNARFERKALQNLEWMVAMDLFETETAGFWKGPGVNSADVKTEVFLLPAADSVEKAGSIVTSGRRIQWRGKVAKAPGDAKEDGWILNELAKALKEVYKGSSDSKDKPIIDLAWDYGDTFDIENVAKELNGYALEDVVDADKKVLVAKGQVIPAFATIASAANPDAIACGVWIYGGYMALADDGTGVQMAACKRRGQKDPGGLGMYPYWGFSWPANRHVLYNRASAKPDGTPWAEKKKLIWWDAAGKKWVGYDVPDFGGTKAPDSKADPAGVGLNAQAGTDPFIMQADGKGWLFSPKKMNEGPLPEHYEPVESPTKNLMSKTNNNPVIKLWAVDKDKEIGDNLGTPDKFPIIGCTYRVVEHWQTGTMSRTLPWLAEAQPEMFIEISKELAEEKGIKSGDWVTVSSARGEIKAVAVVTVRFKPFIIDGKKVHQIGMTWHFGWMGLAKGDVANDLTPHVGDANTQIPEYKAFLVDIKKA